MNYKKLIKSFLVMIIMLAVIFTTVPTPFVAAASEDKYLVLIGNSNGTYTAYDDIALKNTKNKIMVKAEPLADALGIKYKDGNGKEPGCVLTYGFKSNTYTRSSKDYYYRNKTKTVKKTAEYPQSVLNGANLVHYATLETLVFTNYFSNVQDYQDLGYTGVIVYSKYTDTHSIPDPKTVKDTNGKYLKTELNAEDVTVYPYVDYSNYIGSVRIHDVRAIYEEANTNEYVLLDLAPVLNSFKTYNLPADGIYGYANCKDILSIKALDSNGNTIGEIKNNTDMFVIDFPGAAKLLIQYSQIGASPYIKFTPVKPTIITETTLIPFDRVDWLYNADGFAMQYFVVPKGYKMSVINFYAPYYNNLYYLQKYNENYIETSPYVSTIAFYLKPEQMDTVFNAIYFN